MKKYITEKTGLCSEYGAKLIVECQKCNCPVSYGTGTVEGGSSLKARTWAEGELTKKEWEGNSQDWDSWEASPGVLCSQCAGGHSVELKPCPKCGKVAVPRKIKLVLKKNVPNRAKFAAKFGTEKTLTVMTCGCGINPLVLGDNWEVKK